MEEIINLKVNQNLAQVTGVTFNSLKWILKEVKQTNR